MRCIHAVIAQSVPLSTLKLRVDKMVQHNTYTAEGETVQCSKQCNGTEWYKSQYTNINVSFTYIPSQYTNIKVNVCLCRPAQARRVQEAPRISRQSGHLSGKIINLCTGRFYLPPPPPPPSSPPTPAFFTPPPPPPGDSTGTHLRYRLMRP